MKHPVTGPRVTAVLILLLAGLVSSKFFSRPSEGTVHQTSSCEGLSPEDQRTAAEEAHAADRRQAISIADIQLDENTAGPLPTWAALQQSELDRLIQDCPAQPIPRVETVELEPLSPWVNSNRLETPASGTASTAPTPSVPHQAAAAAVGFSSSVRSGPASRPLEEEHLEEVSAAEVEAGAEVHRPRLKSHGLPQSIDGYRSSPWEHDEGFEQSIQGWAAVGVPPAASTPIKWPDQLLRRAAHENLPASPLADARPSQNSSHDSEREGKLLSAARLSADQLERLRARNRQPKFAGDTTSGHAQRVAIGNHTHLSQDTPQRSFVFQPGIRAQP